MGIFDNLFKPRGHPQNVVSGQYYQPFFGFSTSKKSVTPLSGMRTSAVYACVRLLSQSVAQLPLHLYEYRGRGKEYALNHPLYFLLHNEPNPEMTSYKFRETAMTHLLLWGNHYSQIIRDGFGNVVALYPLMPDRMTVDRDEKGNLFYKYQHIIGDPKAEKTETVILSKRDVLHIPGLGFDGVIGYSPIAMARDAVGASLSFDEYGASVIANGARPGGTLEFPGQVQDKESIKEAWNSAFGGVNNAGKVAILENGMKYTPLTPISPADAQFLENRKFQIDEIARIFGVPPHLIADLDHATFSNIEHQDLEFLKHSLQPWLSLWESYLMKCLFDNRNEKVRYSFRFNVNSLMRGDYLSRMNGYAIARQNGWMNADEIRELEDMNAIPDGEGGDLYLVNGSFAKLKDAGIAYADKQTEGGEDK